MKPHLLKPSVLVLVLTSASLYAQEEFDEKVKFSGGGGSPLFQSFLNQDKTWYQDARQAYHGNDLVGGDGRLQKMDWALVYTLFNWTNHTAANPGASYVADDARLPYADGEMLIEIVSRDEQVGEQIMPAIAGMGAANISREGRVINAWLPVSRMGDASQLDGVEFVRPAYRTTNAGLVASQGDVALRTNLGRDLSPGFSGEGITIGTLSDSFAKAPAPATSVEDDVSNGDLPSGVQVLGEFTQAATDEGRAMMQIIHDLAPGVSQQFFTAFNGQASFANGIRVLADAGSDIIVDDVFYFAEPFFQNGVIAQAVNDVTEDGVVYFSAAGNSGRQSYQSPFRTATGQTGLSGGPLHDFDPGPATDAFLNLTIPVGSALTFVMQWDQPFVSVSGAPGSQSDIDVFVTGSGNGQFQVLNGAFANNVGGDAVDIFTFTNDGSIDIDGLPGADTQFNMAVEGIAGPIPGVIKILFLDSGPFSVNEFDTQSGTLVGHANAESCIAVAAAPFFGTPAFGVTPPQLESFSSPGGNAMLFADDGTRLEQPLNTAQPRITAADGGNTTFFGSDLSSGFPSESDTFPNFFGTSAAAPHAAAVAGLILEKAGGPGSLTPLDVDTILRATAIDMGAPGIDEESGAGLIDTQAALNGTPLGYSTFVRREFAPEETETLSDDDPDGDGQTNALEFFAGTNPNLADGAARLSVLRSTGGNLELSFPISPEVDPRRGTIFSSTDLLDWSPVDGATAVFPDGFPIDPATAPRSFFQLRVGTAEELPNSE
ncbi:S8 family serine peptidase [Verrucomicrobiales bacterium]|nr:S8 family serine peptidase [Verrucomicrobiales bacterium]